MQPSLSTVREIALSLGYDAEVRISPAADPVAATAARYLYDSAFPDDYIEQNPGIQRELDAWLERFDRWQATEPTDIVPLAGRLSSPGARPAASWFDPLVDGDADDLMAVAASAGQASGENWLLSGTAAASVLTSRDELGAVLLWVDDTPSACRHLSRTLRPRATPAPAGVVVVPRTGTEDIDPLVRGALRFVAPLQAVLDLYGIGLGDAAEAIMEGW